MTIAAERLVANVPGRMESHPRQRALAHPLCTLQELDPEEFHNTLCDAVHHEAKKLKIRNDEATFRMSVAFFHAHGIPKGEVTTFSNVGAVTANSRRAK